MISETTPRQDAGFVQFPLEPSLQRAVAAAGFTEPRAIQAQTIPAALEGRDVLGLAQTGTGKTAAFALPILQRLLTLKRPGPRALIIAPTRELATQIHTELKMLAQFTRIKAVTIFGGVGQGQQVRDLRGRPDIIIACPGRLLDLLRQGEVNLSAIETLVLDEADHMFDMGFLPDIRQILQELPAKRQNLLFSATMPAEIRSLANALLQNPHVVELSHSRPASTIEHALYSVPAHQKFDVLRYILREDGFTSGIVFLRTKHRAKRLAKDLTQAGHSAVALEGNMTQSQRDRAMSGFREGRFALLVATDIAARGLDVAELSHVINFDVPGTPDAYTHRIGRTGRAERSGKAYTLFCAQELPEISAIERRLGGRIKRLAMPSLDGLPPMTVASSSVGPRDSAQAPHGGRAAGNNGGRSRRGPTYGSAPTGRNAGYSGRRGNGRSANSSRKP